MRTDILLACLGMTMVTWLCRALFTLSVSRIRVTPWWERYLTFIPFAVLTALVAPYLFFPGTEGKLSLVNPHILAGAGTFFLSWRTRNLILSVAGGMGVFFLLGMMF